MSHRETACRAACRENCASVCCQRSIFSIYFKIVFGILVFACSAALCLFKFCCVMLLQVLGTLLQSSKTIAIGSSDLLSFLDWAMSK